MMVSRIFSAINAIKSIYSVWWFVFAGGWVVVMAVFETAIRAVVGNVLYLVIFTIIIVLILIAGLLWFLWYLLGNRPGTNTPRYLNWYKFPLRKIKWNFENYLSMTTSGGKGPIIIQFNARIMVNRGNAIKPKKAIIKSLNRGTELELKIETAEHYKPASEISQIPKSDRYYMIKGVFDPAMDDVDFLKEYSGFEFIFDYDNTSFKRKFSREGIKLMVDRCREYAAPPPKLYPY